MHTMTIEPELELIEVGGVMLDFADIARVGEVIPVPKTNSLDHGYQFMITPRGCHSRPVPSPVFEHPVMAEHSRQAIAGVITRAA